MSALMCASEEGNISGLEELAAAANLDVNMANEVKDSSHLRSQVRGRKAR